MHQDGSIEAKKSWCCCFGAKKLESSEQSALQKAFTLHGALTLHTPVK
jgi:hypothetical protein